MAPYDLPMMSRAWRDAVVSGLRVQWHRHGTSLLAVAVACMVAAALWRLGNELPRLLFDPEGAFDLRLRFREVNRWFAGLPVYDEAERGDYPPASYVILWPLLGWLSLAQSRWLWGLTSIVALGVIALLAVRETGARTRMQVLLVAVLPFSVYATNASIAMGQVGNHIVAFLLAGLLVLRHAPGRWRDDALAAVVMLPALVKPTLSAPFFWIVCFRPGRLRPIVLVCLGYLGVTMLAIAFQEGPLLTRLTGWLAERPQALHGHTNIHRWMALLGLHAWLLPVSLMILAATGWWIHRHRRADLWILLGVAALVAQFWVHHRLYDHVLVLVPMITLLRLSWRGAQPDGSDVLAGVLFTLTWGTMHAPATMLAAPPPLSTVLEAGQAVVWLAVLAFLVQQGRRVDVGTAVRSAPGPQLGRTPLGRPT